MTADQFLKELSEADQELLTVRERLVAMGPDLSRGMASLNRTAALLRELREGYDPSLNRALFNDRRVRAALRSTGAHFLEVQKLFESALAFYRSYFLAAPVNGIAYGPGSGGESYFPGTCLELAA